MASATDKIITEKIRLLEESPDKFVSKMTDVQKQLWEDVKKTISELDTLEGDIVTSQKNIDKILKIEKQIKKAFANTEYSGVAGELITDVKKAKTLNLSYFKKTFGEVKDKAAQIGYEVNKTVIEEQLLSNQTFDAVLFNPLKKQLVDGVTNGMKLSDLIDNVESFVKGDEKRLGFLEKYTKQIANDAFATTERTYSSMIADSIGVQFVRYTGGLISDSRCFCEERNGKYFHIEEVRAWGDGDLEAGGLNSQCDEGGGTWQGQFIGTNSGNIEQWLGGYNCKHSLVFVSEINVPEDVKERARQAGYYK